MSEFEHLLDALAQHGCKVTGSGRKREAQCPHHEDSKPSLSITEVTSRILVYCHGGCETSDVLEVLGLTMRDLYPEAKGTTLAKYFYLGPTGTVNRTVHRAEDKRFWQSGNTSGKPTLYRLPQVVAAVANGSTIYLVEGEEDVHALEYLGVVATTAPMGASGFTKVDVSPLTGAHIVAIPDQDEPGHRWTEEVSDQLNGVVTGLEIRRPAAGNDASDHIAAGLGIDDLILVETLKPQGTDTGHRRVVTTTADMIRPRPVFWVWEDRLALGTLGLLAGREGLGKSTLGYWLAARITRGELPGHYEGIPKAVLVCATEDSWEHTIVPRLIAAGAALTRIHRVEVLNADDIHVGLSLPRDLLGVEQVAQEADAALLLLDPLMSRLPDFDTHRDSEVRLALEPLVAIADRNNMSILGLIHHNKSDSSDPIQLVMGSRAFTAVARSVHTVMHDPDDDTDARRLFGTPKNNLGRIGLPTLSFTIESHAIDTDEGTAWTGRLQWGAERAESIADTMRRSADCHENRTATAEAAEWLEEYMAMNGGRVLSSDAKSSGKKAGHSEASIKRGRARLHLKVTAGGTYPRVTYWETPDGLGGSLGKALGSVNALSTSGPVGSQSAQSPRGE